MAAAAAAAADLSDRGGPPSFPSSPEKPAASVVAESASGGSPPASGSGKTRKKRGSHSLRKAPQAPKRFKSSYICFFMAKQPEIKETLGDDATVSAEHDMWRPFVNPRFYITFVLVFLHSSHVHAWLQCLLLHLLCRCRLQQYPRNQLKCGAISQQRTRYTGTK